MNYGIELMLRADYEGAERYFMRTFELRPNSANLHTNMAILYSATDNSQQAEKYFMRAIELEPREPQVYFFYARFLYENGRFDEAEENLKSAIQRTPVHLEAMILLMHVYYQKWDFRKLADISEDIIRFIPNDEQASYFLALARSIEEITPEIFLQLSYNYYQLGDYERSIGAALEALKLMPNYGYAYNNLSAAYNKLEEWDNAIEAAERALELNPDSQGARHNLDFAREQQMLSRD